MSLFSLTRSILFPPIRSSLPFSSLILPVHFPLLSRSFSTAPSPATSSSTPSLNLTDSARHRISQLRSKYGSHARLRLSVDAGGCSGFSYQFSVDGTQTQQNNENNDETQHCENMLVVDSISLPLLTGSVIDYTVSIERSGFVVLSNPNAKSSCGCGSSFTKKEN
jgi:iron-sulfur cluster assembly accessory protein